MSNSESTKQPGGEAQAAEGGGSNPQRYTLTLTQTDGGDRPVTISIEVVNDSIQQLSAADSSGANYDVQFYLRRRKGAERASANAESAGSGSGGGSGGHGGGHGGGGGGDDDDDDDDDGGGDECKFCTVVNGQTSCTSVPCPQ